MATPSKKLVEVLRTTAKRINESSTYQWGHMGSCNCGHLAQVLTNLSKSQIHKYAMLKYGDWSEQIADYCPTSYMPFDLMLSEILKVGLEREDLINLERLTDPNVLRLLPSSFKLKHNKKEDVVLYIKIWANLIENQLGINKEVTSELFEEDLIEFISDFE